MVAPFHYLKTLFTLSLIFGILIQFANAEKTDNKNDALQFSKNLDASFDLIAKNIKLATLLEEISTLTGIKVYVAETEKNSLVSINLKQTSLFKILQHIIGDNYLISFNSEKVSSLHILTPAVMKTKLDQIDVTHEFSGKIKITHNRATMFFMPNEDTKKATKNYITNRHKILTKLAKTNSHQAFSAQISFTDYLTINQIIELVNRYNLSPVTLNIGLGEHGGNYDLRTDETIESATMRASDHHKEFVTFLLEDAKSVVNNLRKQKTNKDQLQAGLKLNSEAEELITSFNNNGPLFYGMRVENTAQTLLKLVKVPDQIRLIDPLWGGLVENQTADVYPINKISIPLIPEKP